MRLKVAVIGGASDGLQLTLDRLPITLGREGDSVLPINDRWASRHHCQIFEQSGHVYVRDLGSKHGTLVNGKPIDDCRLNEGDRLMIGLSCLQIQEIGTALDNVESLVDRGSGVSA